MTGFSAFDFDTPVERRGTDSEKWGRYAGRDVLPLWVADMDFVSPPAVMEALRSRVDHGVFGYGHPTDDLVAAVRDDLDRRYGWKVDPDWLVWLPGLVSGLSVCCRSVGEAGDGVGVLTPVYPPFLKVPALMQRALETVPLAGDNAAGWRLDAGKLARGLSDRARLLLLCHPHNPVGRAWAEDELQAVAEVCLERRLVICSDEIHCGLVLDRHRRHQPLATLGPEVAARTITLMAPSKTWNIAGLGCAFAVIPAADLRRRFRRAAAGIVPHPNVLGMAAAAAAYRHGEPWRIALLDYLRGNRDYLAGCVAGWSGVTMARVEATYLAWLDVRGLELERPHAFFVDHGVGLSDGRDFGAPGFLRLNFGCPRALLAEACERMEAAVRAAAS